MTKARNGVPEMAAQSSYSAFRDLNDNSAFFREKLIQEFNIIESLDASNSSSAQGLHYSTRDFINKDIQEKLLTEAPGAMIWFADIKRAQNTNTLDRRLIRTKHQKFMPVGPWAAWITKELPFYDYGMLVLIILYCISIGLQADLALNPFANYQIIRILTTIDMIFLSMFIYDTILHLIDNAEDFFQDYWKVFDMILNIIIFFPTVISLYTEVQSLSTGVKLLRIFAIFKLVARIESLRTITMIIFQALQTMAYIILFIAMFGLVFSIVGINLYEDYTKSEVSGLLYQDYFSSVAESAETIFILMTLDQWDPINRDLAIITNPTISYIFILFWTWVGAFIFRNIFVGVMIQNFKRISYKLEQEERLLQKQKRLEKIHERIRTELLKTRKSSMRNGSNNATKEDHLSRVQQLMEGDILYDQKWESLCKDTLEMMAKSQANTECYWPRDSMFKYLQSMESFMENLAEYQELSLLARRQLLELHDS